MTQAKILVLSNRDKKETTIWEKDFSFLNKTSPRFVFYSAKTDIKKSDYEQPKQLKQPKQQQKTTKKDSLKSDCTIDTLRSWFEDI